MNPCPPKAAFGCSGSSLNPYTAICWPSPLSAKELQSGLGQQRGRRHWQEHQALHTTHKEKAPPSIHDPPKACCLSSAASPGSKHVTANLTPWDLVPFLLFSHYVASECPITFQGSSFLPHKVRRRTGWFPRPRPALAFCKVWLWAQAEDQQHPEWIAAYCSLNLECAA